MSNILSPEAYIERYIEPTLESKFEKESDLEKKLLAVNKPIKEVEYKSFGKVELESGHIAISYAYSPVSLQSLEGLSRDSQEIMLREWRELACLSILNRSTGDLLEVEDWCSDEAIIFSVLETMVW